MGVDRRAIAQNAQALASKGQFDAAIAEWKKLLSNSSADGAVHNSIGDLQLRRNASKDAIASFIRAADAFRAEGATLKAIAAYKKILKVDPRCLEIYQHLGDLNAERGLVSSAVADYSTLARLLLKDGKPEKSLAAFRRILKLDPSNATIKKHAQELATRQKIDLEQFLSQPDTGPIVGKSSGPPADAKQADPNSREGQLAEAVRQIDEGKYEGAESVLSQLLSREPGDPEVCQLLARLHLKKGELPIALNEYQFLAGAALRADDHQLAESLILEYLQVDPASVPLLEILGAVYEKRDDPQTAAEQYGKALQLLLETPDPDMPTLPAELYDRIKELAPNSDLHQQFVTVFEPSAAPEASAPAAEETPVEVEEAVVPEPEPEPVAEDVETSPEPEPEPVAEQHAEPEPEPVVATAAPAPPQRPSEEELETHFTLGRAYRDMGLLSEAMEEFRVSVTSDALFLDSCLELAGCLRERGMSRRAIACLEHAMSDTRCQGERSQAVRYDLGQMYEAEGLFDRALRVFETITGYEDVAKRIEWIKGGGQKEAAAEKTSTAPAQEGEILTAPAGRDRKKRRISYL